VTVWVVKVHLGVKCDGSFWMSGFGYEAVFGKSSNCLRGALRFFW
jgi:hypothetical protein